LARERQSANATEHAFGRTVATEETGDHQKNRNFTRSTLERRSDRGFQRVPRYRVRYKKSAITKNGTELCAENSDCHKLCRHITVARRGVWRAKIVGF
jgi:hypothetical protein